VKTLEVLKRLNGFHGAEVYLVGGFVRDLIRRKRNDDLDVVIRLLGTQEIKKFLDRYGTAKFVHLTFGVPIILFKAFGDMQEAQITFPRDRDGNFTPIGNLEEDSSCRDFTINAMYLPIDFRSRNEVIDFHGGYADIRKRIIRTIRKPERVIKDSPIRLLRAVSLAARTGYRIQQPLMRAISHNRQLLRRAPVEGVRAELYKILLCRKPSTYLKVMRKLGLLEIVMPELNHCAGVRQDRKYHKYDVFKHCLYTCDHIEPDLILRLAAVLHDVGKPDTRVETKDRVTFHKHEVISVRLARRFLERLRYKKETTRKVLHLIRMHMYHYTRDFSDAAVRRFIKKVGIVQEDLDNLRNIPLFKLRRAERLGNGYKTNPVTERQLDFEKRIVEVFKESKGFEVKDLDIDGNVIMKIFNMEQSPKVGDVLAFLLERVLENPKVNERKELVKLAAEYIYYKM